MVYQLIDDSDDVNKLFYDLKKKKKLDAKLKKKEDTQELWFFFSHDGRLLSLAWAAVKDVLCAFDGR